MQIEEAIVDGRLRPGDRLPSERELAETFGVSRASVREALRALEVFGVVVARRGTGPDAGSIVADGAGEGLSNARRLHVTPWPALTYTRGAVKYAALLHIQPEPT